MTEVTRILTAIEKGDPHAAEQLLPLVYDELRNLAAQRLAQKDQPRKNGMFDAVGLTLGGVALLQQDKPQQGFEVLQQAQVIFQETLGAGHPMTQLYGLNNAIALMQLGRTDAAMALVSHADPVLREAFGLDAPAYAKVLRLRTRLVWLLKADEAASPYLPSKQRPDQSLAFEFFS